MYIIQDESGNLGYEHYFVIGLTTTDNLRSLEKCLKITKRCKLPRKLRHLAEVKIDKVDKSFLKYFYTHLVKEDFNIHYRIVDNLKLSPKFNIYKNKGLLYLGLTIILLEECLPLDYKHVCLYTDNIRLKGLSSQNFIETMKKKFSRPSSRFDVYPVDSTTSLGIQVAHFIAWAIFQKYERNNHQWYNILSPKIKTQRPLCDIKEILKKAESSGLSLAT